MHLHSEIRSEDLFSPWRNRSLNWAVCSGSRLFVAQLLPLVGLTLSIKPRVMATSHHIMHDD